MVNIVIHIWRTKDPNQMNSMTLMPIRILFQDDNNLMDIDILKDIDLPLKKQDVQSTKTDIKK